MRIFRRDLRSGRHTFLSIQAQDFIEEATSHTTIPRPSFLSIQAQDFIEEEYYKATKGCRAHS